MARFLAGITAAHAISNSYNYAFVSELWFFGNQRAKKVFIFLFDAFITV